MTRMILACVTVLLLLTSMWPVGATSMNGGISSARRTGVIGANGRSLRLALVGGSVRKVHLSARRQYGVVQVSARREIERVAAGRQLRLPK
jgi:hypothetical protein